ncbi:MAG TPA: hypothetical protein VIU11_14405 [Nakamurella sp.]
MGTVGWFAIALQGLGGLAVAVGLFLAFSPGIALALCGVAALAGGTVLEIGHHPRPVVAPSPTDRRAALIDDYRRTASER